jgi:two-component system, NtrC family, sensor kinase
MSAPSDEQRRMRWFFFGLLALILVLQAATLLIQSHLRGLAKAHQQTVAFAEHQTLVARDFERTSYLALVGLAAADWELLLRQRTAVQTLSEQFKEGIDVLQHGAVTELRGVPVQVDSVEDEDLQADLVRVLELWEQADAAQVRLLRSNNYELADNHDLDAFYRVTDELVSRLDEMTATLRARRSAALGELARLQLAVPLAALALVVVLGTGVWLWLIIPFGRNVQALHESRELLQVARDELELRVQERTRELAGANEQLRKTEEQLRQSHERLEHRVELRTRELRETQRKLVDSALAAGRAEVATNILHNVGNVLNSVNVHAELMNERLHDRQWTALRKVAELLEEHEGDLMGLFGEGGRGRVLPAYLTQLATEQHEARNVLVDYLLQLRRQIDHIKEIVVLQQRHARSVGLVEEIALASVVEDAVSINLSAIERHDIIMTRELDDVPLVRMHKHKVLQILVNLISNAKYALADTPRGQRHITVRVTQPDAEHVRIAVLDNGCGIAPELLTSIFQHGFTTREEGHGFGLHASSLAAIEMGAELHVASDGPGRGACFTLDLPLAPKD